MGWLRWQARPNLAWPLEPMHGDSGAAGDNASQCEHTLQVVERPTKKQRGRPPGSKSRAWEAWDGLDAPEETCDGTRRRTFSHALTGSLQTNGEGASLHDASGCGGEEREPDALLVEGLHKAQELRDEGISSDAELDRERDFFAQQSRERRAAAAGHVTGMAAGAATGASKTKTMKGPWSEEEDEVVRRLVAQYGHGPTGKRWSLIASNLPGRECLAGELLHAASYMAVEQCSGGVC